MSKTATARMAFIRWVAGAFPGLYRAAVGEVGMPQGLGGLFDGGGFSLTDSSTWHFDPQTSGGGGNLPTFNTTGAGAGSGWWDKFTDALTNLGTAYVTVRGQDQLVRLNIERARQGLAPVSAQQAGVQPSVGVDVRADRSATLAAALVAATPIIAIVGGVLLLRSVGKSKRGRK